MARFSRKIWQRPKAFLREEAGTTMVEYALVIALFLLILFAILDFGRLGYHWISVEKAMQRAVRIATVRPPVCEGVPVFHLAGSGSYSAGTLCRDGNDVCEAPGPITCSLNNPEPNNALAAATANEIYNSIVALLPPGLDNANVYLTYEYDAKLGFFGGPYVPKITARLAAKAGDAAPLTFSFVTPLSRLAGVAGATGADSIPGSIPFPDISATLPAEDMNIGQRG